MKELNEKGRKARADARDRGVGSFLRSKDPSKRIVLSEGDTLTKAEAMWRKTLWTYEGEKSNLARWGELAER